MAISWRQSGHKVNDPREVAVQYSTVQYSTLLYSTLRYCTAQRSTADSLSAVISIGRSTFRKRTEDGS